MALLDALHEEEEHVIILGKNVGVGWYHVRLLVLLFPTKKIIFITKDERIKNLLKHSGYRSFATMSDIDRLLPEGFQIMQENLNTLEYLRFHVSRFFGRFYFFARGLKPKSGVFEVKHSSWYMLVLGIVVVLFLLVGIVSLTTPHASIMITPQMSIQNAMKNVVFVPEESLSDPAQIPLKKDTFPFSESKVYTINSFDPASLKRAEGTLKITNSWTDSLRIKAQTRLVSGVLVFRTLQAATIPGATGTTPGEITVPVIADPVATDGVVMGKRGNITANTSLIFPGLSAKDHENIVVVSNENFHGGDDSAAPLLTQAEFDRVKKVFTDQIQNDAENFLAKKYDKSAEFLPLPIPDAMTTVDVNITSDVGVGAHVAEIHLSAKADFMIYLYSQPALRKTLLDTAKSHLLENTESLVEISDSPPDIIATLSTTDNPFSIKATAQIPVQILYDFTSPTGQKTLQNILSDLLGADADRATKTLLNHPYVKSVDIRLTPFWSTKLPNTLDKIFISVNKPQN